MKPINEMTLAECIARLRELPDGTVDDACDAKMLNLPLIFNVAVDLADRIDKLLYEQAQRHDARVDALENEINALRAEHRWIPVEDGLPTKEDADERGNVLWLFWGEHYESRYWNLRGNYGMTHWRRIDTPDSPTPSGQVAGMRYE